MFKELVFLMVAAGMAVSAVTVHPHTANKDFLEKQKKVYDLFYYKTVTPELLQLGQSYDIWTNIDSYGDKSVVKEFLNRYQFGMLPKGKLYSTMYDKMREETTALYNLLYQAKDFDTFYKTAVWAKVHLNKWMFDYAYQMAVYHRPDTKYMTLPPAYEVIPFYFFDSQLINHVEKIKMEYGVSPAVSSQQYNNFMVYANYTSMYSLDTHLEKEHKLNYFTEDIGMNLYYYYLRSIYPSILTDKNLEYTKDVRGVLYLQGHQMLMSRYYLERLSNGLEDIEDFDWTMPYVPGFHSDMIHPNGVLFPQRKSYTAVPFYKCRYMTEAREVESRIMELIDSGYVYGTDGKPMSIYTPAGLNILGNIIEGNKDSFNWMYYKNLDVLMRKFFGATKLIDHKYNIVPNALDYQVSSMRDPAFYRIYKKIVNMYLRYQMNLPPYTYDQLNYPGVKIRDVVVDRLTTYFDQYDVPVTKALTFKDRIDEMSYTIKARQYRLNHKPYTYTFNIESDKDTTAYMRIFLGPAYDIHGERIDFETSWMKYYILDHFPVTLKNGENKIIRKSSESPLFVPDYLTSEEFYTKLQKAMEGSEPFVFEKMFGWPQRMMLPKGKTEGMPYRLFFYVSEYDQTASTMELPLLGKVYDDEKGINYPLDRRVHIWNWVTPNMYYKDVFVYHETLRNEIIKEKIAEKELWFKKIHTGEKTGF